MRRRPLITPVLAFFMILVAAPCLVDAQPLPHRAPGVDPVDQQAGFVPPTVDLAHVAPPAISAAKRLDLPARFDWRPQGQVTPARDQGACGACYAFSAAGELEARVLRDFGTATDLSENFLKECHYEERSCNGGNAQMVMNLLSRRGVVDEVCDPYVAGDAPCDLGCDAAFAVLDWIWVSGSTMPATADLKQALVDHGPLSTTVYSGDAGNAAWWNTFGAWNGGDGLFYDGAEQNNHAVLLVGWDDDQPHTGGGTGCWIVKNSWGDGWGDSCDHGGDEGYFYIAYESAGIGLWTSAMVEIMASYPELAVLSWDEGGWNGSYGYGMPTAWGLGQFQATEDTRLHRVEFWTTDATMDVDIYVYDQFTGGALAGPLAAVENLSFAAAGYHSVALPAPVDMLVGNDYYVAVRFQNVSYGYPLAIDSQGARGAGHTWISYNGTSWVDLGDTENCEAGIRIRTSPHTVLPVNPPDDPDLPPVPAASAFELEAPWPNPFNPSTGLAFILGSPGTVQLRVFDLQGRLVRTLLDADIAAGRHTAQWNGRDDQGRVAPAGVYLARLANDRQYRTRQMVLLK